MKLKINIRFNIFIFIIFIISFFIYFRGYQNPPKQFWDENYHVASAQRYIDGVFFLEPHPPLGKLIIALGEKMINPNKNINTKNFDKTDYIRSFPKNYSFKGVRFFPTFFGWLNALLLFIILYQLTNKSILSFFGASLYMFDNALVVHSRAAMLESTQIFFILFSLFIFLYIHKKPKRYIKDYIFFSLFFAFAVMIKLNSLIIILLYIWLFYKDIRNGLGVKNVFFNFIGIIVTFLSISYLVFSIHFAISKKIVKNRTYGMSRESVKLLKRGELTTLIGIKEYISYMKRYERKVPKYNSYKKNENGSLCMTWPIMDKCINYRWHKVNQKVQYLYLVGNPIVWLIGFLGVIGAIVLVGGRYLYDFKVNREKFNNIQIFTFLYISYMIAILRIDRVMYLYHYFIPLLLSFILAVLVLDYIFEDEIKKNDKIFYATLSLLFILMVYVFWFFSPLTYYHYMDTMEFNKRVWFDFWHLKAVT